MGIELSEIFRETAVLKIENRKLRSLVEDFDERNHELCMRYFRMKQCKDLTWNKLRQVDEDYLEVRFMFSSIRNRGLI